MNWTDEIKTGMNMIANACHASHIVKADEPIELCMTKCPLRNICFHIVKNINQDKALAYPWNWDNEEWIKK